MTAMAYATPIQTADRDTYARYLWWSTFWELLIIGPLTLGLLWLAWIAWLFCGSWFVRRSLDESESVIDGDTLRLKRGVWWKSVCHIPLVKITDVRQLQGPFERYFGLWTLEVVTAGEGSSGGYIQGVRDIEEARRVILSARDRAATS